MAITSEQIVVLRRYIDEPTTATYSDLALNDIYMTFGEDLNLVAAEVWRDKAAKSASLVDESEGPSSLKLSQIYTNATRQADYYQGRSDSNTAVASPRRTTTRPIERG
jgi:hypothetical protein